MRKVLAILPLLLAGACSNSHALDVSDAGAAVDAHDAALDTELLPSGWTSRTLLDPVSPFDFGPALSADLAIDTHDRFHIAHIYQDRGDVLYTSNVSGRWETETVERGIGPLPMGDSRAMPTFVRLALSTSSDGSVEPLMVYDHGALLGPTFVTGSPWSLRALDFAQPSYGVGAPNMARLADGRLFFAGLAPTSALDGSSAAVRVIGSDGSVAEPISLSLGPNFRTAMLATTDGWIHLTVEANTSTWLTSRSPAGVWTNRRFGDGYYGAFSALAERPDHTLHLAFSPHHEDPSEAVLVHIQARSDGSNMVATEILTRTEWVNVGAIDIAVDAEGFVHIVFGVSKLEYATNLSGRWQSQPIDELSSTSGMPSLALDAAGNPWIAYRDMGSALRLVTRSRASLR